MSQKNNNKSLWLRFTTMGLQMGLTIYLCSILGGWLDVNHPSNTFNYKKILTLFGVFGTTVSTIRQVIKISNDE
jgi:hypothetical protein